MGNYECVVIVIYFRFKKVIWMRKLGKGYGDYLFRIIIEV